MTIKLRRSVLSCLAGAQASLTYSTKSVFKGILTQLKEQMEQHGNSTSA